MSAPASAVMADPADHSRPPEDGRASIRDWSSSSPQNGTAAERLTDDLLVEILSRVPAKSLCRFKCVSNHWLCLIDHPDHRKKLPQTLAGFFYTSRSEPFLESHVRFVSVPGSHNPLIDTSFAYLPKHEHIYVLDCCNGLLLYGLYAQEISYIVCNPATEKWVTLPNSGQAAEQVVATCLCFDPDKSPHFHVFEFVEEEGDWTSYLAGVAVYSSETRRWVYMEKKWNGLACRASTETVFLNGHLYFHSIDRELSSCCITMVDTEGETWMNFIVPDDDSGLADGFIQCSQGRLHYVNFYRDENEDEDDGVIRLEVYVLENCESKEWKLKHIAETSDLFGEKDVDVGLEFEWFAIHPECNLVFFTVGKDITLMCYNMDSRQVQVIRNLEDGKLPFLPYVPLYAELQSLHM